MASEIDNLNSHEAKTVCEALGRYEDTLRGAVREIHVDIQVFKQGVSRQVDEVLRLASPLARTVSELQQENQRLRVQLERLARQVEALGRSAGLPQEWQEEAERSPPAVGPSSPVPAFSGDRFSTLAKLAVSGRSQSVDLDDHHKPEFRRVFSSSLIENGHQSSSGQAKASHELTSFYMSDSSPEAHAPAMTLQMPHLPVTAVTRISEKFSGENIHSAGTTNASTGLLGQNQSKNEMTLKTSNQSVNATSVTKPVSTASYEASSGNKTGESAADSYCGMTPKAHSSPPTVHRQVERRRELVRSQTLPRTTGTQARKALFEKFEQDSGKGKGQSRAKLKRSQSFGVASASSIKQILLDWCRSKTIGYKHIDLQNFSSSWNDGMAFCALVHSFFPESFDYNKLDPANRKQNFELAFTMAEKMAHCDRLIEVDDMMMMGHKPDPMCVFTYVQSLYNHLRHFE
ncbi:smoothelin-like protein 2 isoform X2 [Gallus gallus]|uniref:smoothelin-like protein 2 isoform X2 n=1 Tax=Gallus gallus TaxID=9031 RepID=UPI0000ECA480|nr:smoothelin-like protein 2 isoform X2 [Gallus gallus]XP_046786401.1 smoothelin-like protein 2 isoform X2 [Gallus gallus]|eukprot:XP_415932.3 smoothelin-like protein 2 isoform X2 [Gallus gallus]